MAKFPRYKTKRHPLTQDEVDAHYATVSRWAKDNERRGLIPTRETETIEDKAFWGELPVEIPYQGSFPVTTESGKMIVYSDVLRPTVDAIFAKTYPGWKITRVNGITYRDGKFVFLVNAMPKRKKRHG